MLIEIESNTQGTTALVIVRGEIDLATVDRLQPAVDDALATRPEILVLDLGEVTFCDSTGVKLVLASQRRAAESDVRFVVVRPVGPARRTFEICKLDGEVTFIDSGEADRSARHGIAIERSAARPR